MNKLDNNQHDPIKLLLEKFAYATSRFIKGEITRKRREETYDEVHLGLTQLSAKKDKPMGVSEWKAIGKQFGYWDYFKKLSLCPDCNCMTKKTCGKCFKDKLLAILKEKFLHNGWHEVDCPAHSRHMGNEEDCNCIFNYVVEELLQ